MKIRPKIRPFESGAVTSAKTLERLCKRASELEKTQEHPGYPEHRAQWFCNGASNLNWMMESWSCPACAKSSAGSYSTRRSCLVLSFLS